ncbi:ATP-dependent DNA helicase RecG [Pacificimonas flava]|uniref:ATP-dependent DNA helicase RecG n=1 Tax=Pacificimonas flava TaxID=1234595 RepID=UPI00056DED0E|nr:ATP-dependent DNA helicase RecG [Pacificimonas flava]MBB5279827.1 ATP-dependent DNA helicase RecG [Pacificimonas flava]
MRPDLLNPLFASVQSIDGVGPRLAKQLGKLGIERLLDLVYHLPAYAVPRRRVAEIADAAEGETVTVALTAQRVQQGSGRRPTRIMTTDSGGGGAALVFFHDRGGYAARQLPIGEARIVSGKVERYGGEAQIVHPDYIVAPSSGDDIPDREPVYGLTEGLTNKRLRQLVRTALESVPDLPEWIEGSMRRREGWAAWRQSLLDMHDCTDTGARERLAYDELLANQVTMLLIRESSRRRRGRPLNGDGALLERLRSALPYRFTGAQERSIAEILGDLGAERPMLRLLQGDVGSGKTAVALAAMLRAVEAGAQAALLAPTEILARQHLASLDEMLFGMNVRTAILTGRETGAARSRTLAELASGAIDILVGTHAIFQDAVTYHDLGLVIIDEQHRFGVNQRKMLTEKGRRAPHVLVMTATPIPRSLTLTQFGEMDESRIDEMPPGREPVETLVLSRERLEEVVGSVSRLLESGGRAYWVCPLVEESEAEGDVAAAETRAEILKKALGAERVGLVHGRMKGEEKDRVMAAFAAGRLQVLVATTVIEVGVNVPEATLMVVEQAERFGLAQLHQLRGRVGRGGGRSVCMLLRSAEISETARERLKLMRSTNDGFAIADRDLELRGGGEILGTRQSGEAGYRVARPEDTARLAEPARDDARLFLEQEGGFEGSKRADAMRTLLYLFERDSALGLLKAG